MELTTAQLAELTGQERIILERAKDEVRGHGRVSVARKVKIFWLNERLQLVSDKVATRDISKNGLGLLCASAIKAGEEITVEFAKADGAFTYLRCRVSRCTRSGSSKFLVGAKFVSIAERSPAPAPKPAAAAAPAGRGNPKPAPAAEPVATESEEVRRIRAAMLDATGNA